MDLSVLTMILGQRGRSGPFIWVALLERVPEFSWLVQFMVNTAEIGVVVFITDMQVM